MIGTVNVLLTYNVFRVLGPAIDPASTSRRTDLLPTHNSQSQMQQQFSGMDRAASLRASTISAKSTMSPYSTLIQSSFGTHQDKLVQSDAVAESLPPLDRHIIPRADTELNSSRSSKSKWTTSAQVAHLEHDAAEMQGLPPPFRPLRTDPLVTGASGSNRQPIQRLGLTIASDRSPRGCRPALSAIMGTLPEELQQITSPTT